MSEIKTVKREAEIGEKIMITNPVNTFGYYNEGDIFTVTESYFTSGERNGVYTREEVPVHISHKEYEVIVEENDSAPESLATLKQAEELLAELRRQAYAEGYEQGKLYQRMETSLDEVSSIVNGDTPRKTARDFLEESRKEIPAETKARLIETFRKRKQEKRDRIVEQAKADIEELKERMISNDMNLEGTHTFRHRTTIVDFVVNKEKRTVVALVKGSDNPVIYERGIAKCAPDDCFNATLGKAIALRRALGLEIPNEYIHAPQPTEVRVGDVIHIKGDPRAYKVLGNYEISMYESRKHLGLSKIIDDSREAGA